MGNYKDRNLFIEALSPAHRRMSVLSEFDQPSFYSKTISIRIDYIDCGFGI